MTMLTTHGAMAMCRDEKCPFPCQPSVPLTLPLVPSVPLTLPSFLLVIATLFLSSITSHPLLPQSPFLPPSFYLSTSLNSIPPTLQHQPLFLHTLLGMQFSTLIGGFVPLICQRQGVDRIPPFTPITFITVKRHLRVHPIPSQSHA